MRRLSYAEDRVDGTRQRAPAGRFALPVADSPRTMKGGRTGGAHNLADLPRFRGSGRIRRREPDAGPGVWDCEGVQRGVVHQGNAHRQVSRRRLDSPADAVAELREDDRRRSESYVGLLQKPQAGEEQGEAAGSRALIVDAEQV